MLEVPWPGTAGTARPQAPQAPLFLKAESLQPMGAFKIRGAFNMIAQLPKENLERGVITYSSGNHGQAVAMAAQKLGAPAVIVMPTTAPQVKIDGCKCVRRRSDHGRARRRSIARSAPSRKRASAA